MGLEDKLSAGMDKAKGKAEEVVGKITGDDEKVAEGKALQAEGDLKQAGEKVKDAVKNVVDD